MTEKRIYNNPGQKDKRLTALTLLEVMVSVSILSIIAVMVFSALVLGERHWKSDMSLLDVHQQARMGMHGMVREIRQKDGTTNVTLNNDSSIDFFITNTANAVRYDLQDGQIIREHPPGSTELPGRRVLANNISSLNFRCYQYPGPIYIPNCADADYVEIRVNATKAAATAADREVWYNLTERVNFRN